MATLSNAVLATLEALKAHARSYQDGYLAGVRAAIETAAGREEGQSYDLHARLEVLLLSQEEQTLLSWLVRRAAGKLPTDSAQHADCLGHSFDVGEVADSLRSKGLIDIDSVSWSPTEAGRYLFDY